MLCCCHSFWVSYSLSKVMLKKLAFLCWETQVNFIFILPLGCVMLYFYIYYIHHQNIYISFYHIYACLQNCTNGNNSTIIYQHTDFIMLYLLFRKSYLWLLHGQTVKSSHCKLWYKVFLWTASWINRSCK
jgi:hypothetical protein